MSVISTYLSSAPQCSANCAAPTVPGPLCHAHCVMASTHPNQASRSHSSSKRMKTIGALARNNWDRRKSHGLATEAHRYLAGPLRVLHRLRPPVFRLHGLSEFGVQVGTTASRSSGILRRDLFGRLEWSRRRPVENAWKLAATEMSSRGQVGYATLARVVRRRYPEA